jgi:hypothetical protein
MVGGHQVRHWFLYVPEAPSPLLGIDLLSKLATPVFMDLGLPDMSTLPVLTLEVSLEEVWRIHPPRENKPFSPQPFLHHLIKWFSGIWDQDERMGLATGHPPILITIKPGANLVYQRQYPIPLEAWKGIAPHIQCLWDPFTPCQKARVQSLSNSSRPAPGERSNRDYSCCHP